MFRRKDEDVAQDLLGDSDPAAQSDKTTHHSQNAGNNAANNAEGYDGRKPTAGRSPVNASNATQQPGNNQHAASTQSQQTAAGMNASGIAATPGSNMAANSGAGGYRAASSTGNGADNAAGSKTRPTAASAAYRPAAAEATRPRVPEYRASAAAPVATPAMSATTHGEGSVASGKSGGNRRVLTVGHDILLKGEIATCDRLVIEGSVDATLNEVHTVEIADSGSFKGSAEIEDAEISGLFEGNLVVRNRLVIYSTGKVRGKITFGEIEIERGGELTGEIRTIDQMQAKRKSTTTKGAPKSSKKQDKEELAAA